MSQKKAQLIDPNETFTATSIKVNSGVVSATSFTGNLTGNVGGLVAAASTSVVSVGVITATSFRGDGTNLSNMPAAPALVGQTTVTSGATHTLDISKGNVVFFKPLHDSTVSFANTGQTRTMQIEMEIKIPTQGKTITWPSNVIWGDVYSPTSPPGIVSNTSQDAKQIFTFTQVDDDSKDLWVAEETVRNDPQAAVGYIWGSDFAGVFGRNTVDGKRSSPVLIGGEKKYFRADNLSNCRGATTDHFGYNFYGICCDGSLWGQGYGDEGALAGCVGGDATSVARSTPYSSPVQISRTISGYCTDVLQVSGGYQSGATIGRDGSIWTWGRIYCGQRFECDQKYMYCLQSCLVKNCTPVCYRNFNNWKTLNTGTGIGYHAIQTDGTLWSWGSSLEGVLGNNKSQDNEACATTPVQICGGGYWTDVTRSENASIGIRSTTANGGALWAWGSNTCGGLGIDASTSTSYSSPVRIGTSCNWTAVGALGKSAFWAKNCDDCVFVWGSNQGGMLGLNDTTTRTTPVHLPGNWARLSSSGTGCAALGIKTDGTLWAWGWNQQGNNGVNDNGNSITARSSPVQVGTDTDWNPRGGLGTFCNNSMAFKSS
tara:strand:- start:695 stop:2491 length:1797 start_codon:yes stop_codon:yes gene_type:complete